MGCVIDKDAPQSDALPAKKKVMLLSPLGERLGEGVLQEVAFALTPSPNLSPKGGEEHES
jgi:hypothetical protein